MGNGQLGVHGQHAAKLAEEEPRLEVGDAIPHHHLEVVEIALENRQNHYNVTQRFAHHVSLNGFSFLKIDLKCQKLGYSTV